LRILVSNRILPGFSAAVRPTEAAAIGRGRGWAHDESERPGDGKVLGKGLKRRMVKEGG
jgi:hypothetical protein